MSTTPLVSVLGRRHLPAARARPVRLPDRGVRPDPRAPPGAARRVPPRPAGRGRVWEYAVSRLPAAGLPAPVFRSRLAPRRRMLGVVADVTRILDAAAAGDP